MALNEVVRSDSHPVLKWLAVTGSGKTPEVTSIQLIAWLQGADGATCGESVEPPSWILRAIMEASRPGDVRRELASWCRYLLLKRPDLAIADGTAHAVYARPGQYLHNLLRLCGLVPHPKLLGEPLLDIYRENVVPAPVDGYDWGRALGGALLPNQVGPELEDEWFAILEDRPSRLGVLPASGLRGIIGMPESREQVGKPWVDRIAKALLLMARYLESTFPKSKVRDFRAFIAEAKGPFDWPTATNDLFRGAAEHEWPLWACHELEPVVASYR